MADRQPLVHSSNEPLRVRTRAAGVFLFLPLLASSASIRWCATFPVAVIANVVQEYLQVMIRVVAGEHLHVRHQSRTVLRRLIHNSYHDPLRSFYTGARLGPDPKTPKDAKHYVDFWQQCLLGKFFDPHASIAPPDMPEDDGRGTIEEAEGEKFRILTGLGAVSVPLTALKHQGLIRIKIGTPAAAFVGSTKVTMTAGQSRHIDGVSKTRWTYWLLPNGTDTATLTIEAKHPCRVYGVEVYDGS